VNGRKNVGINSITGFNPVRSVRKLGFQIGVKMEISERHKKDGK